MNLLTLLVTPFLVIILSFLMVSALLMILPVLFKKELRQNTVLYVIPYIALFAVWFLKHIHVSWLTANWAGILTVAVPIALAVSFGLQAFDLEENGQTRDFLLTKPLSVRSIIWSKYLCGLLVLFPFAAFWHLTLDPEGVKLPTLADNSSFWFLSYLVFLLITYSVCFVTGVFVKGPVKFLAGIFFSLCVIGWFFFGWYEFLTLIILSDWGIRQSLWAYLLIFIVSAGGLILIIALLHNIALRFLKNLSFTVYKLYLLLAALAMVAIPVSFYIANVMTKPVIRPFSSLGLKYLALDETFIAIEGAKQPGKDFYAFASAFGELGLAQKGDKPEIVYRSTIEKPLSNLAWSPNGKLIAFCEDDEIKIFEMQNHAVHTVMKGATPLWSADGRHMIIAGGGTLSPANSEVKNELYRYTLTMVDIATGARSNLGQLTAGKAIGWNSELGKIYSIDNARALVIVDIKSGKAEMMDLSLPDQKQEAVFDGQIVAPAGKGKPFRLIISTITPEAFKKKDKLYNAYFYDFDSSSQQPIRVSLLENIRYEELLCDPGQDEILGRIGGGVYRQTKKPREVWKPDVKSHGDEK